MRCSFCNCELGEARAFITTGPPRAVHICDACVLVCADILAERGYICGTWEEVPHAVPETEVGP